jgi:protein tyrosine phosphatase (PTP) superfamily phosphohydrolase (DUF442 family)
MTEPNQDLSQIQNFRAISERLGTAGQPFEEQLPLIKAAGYQAVINLALPESPDAIFDEPERWAALGVDYINIPVEWDQPQRSDLDRFFGEMDRRQGEKVFVHCARNMRVSAFVFLYRVLRQGEAVEKARADLLAIWEPNATWQKLIDEALKGPASPAEDR